MSKVEAGAHLPQKQAVSLPMPKFPTLRAIGALVLREMGTTYGRSPGGYIWAFLEPIGMIVILAVAFSLLTRSPSLGTNFLLFYATGYLPFSLYTDIAAKVSRSLRFSRPLLAYPRVTWVDAVISRVILNTLTNTTVAAVLLSAILIFTDADAVLDIVKILQGYTMAIILGAGVGLMNCLLAGLSDLWERIWAIVTRPLFLASGLFYIYEDLPNGAQNILWWNPLLHVTGQVRTGFYSTYEASYVSFTYTYGVGMVLTALGLLFLRNNYRKILER